MKYVSYFVREVREEAGQERERESERENENIITVSAGFYKLSVIFQNSVSLTQLLSKLMIESIQDI